MSDYKAIAGVSSTLKRLLTDRMEESATVTLAPPDVKVESITGKRVNLYLYQVTENTSLKNQEIPGQGDPGTFGHPPLSLDLHYLVTSHSGSETSEDADIQAQQLLGSVMRVLHDFAVITADLHEEDNALNPQILDPSLVGEYERVKITLQPVTLDDVSKIWTALPQASFRRSVAYQVSVVQIESQHARRYVRRVGEPPEAGGPRVHAIPLRTPHISEIRVRRPADAANVERPFPYARIDDTLILHGRNFLRHGTRAYFGELEVTTEIQTQSLAKERMEVKVPNDADLQPGALLVKVVQELELGEPPEPHLGFTSNLAVFMLVPRIESLETESGGTVKLTGTRLFHADLECLALVGDHGIKSEHFTTATPTEVKFKLPTGPTGLKSGDHFVRVRVNGAESFDQHTVSIP